MKGFLKKHWPAFLFALVVGFILVSPQLALQFQLGQNYQGVYLTGVDAEVYYPRIKDVYDGNFKAASPAIYEYKAEPYAFAFGGETTVALLGKGLFLDVSQMIVFSNFLFPFLLCLILYFLFFKITNSRLVAITSSLAIILLSNFVFFPRNFFYIFTHPSLITSNPYNRLVSPQVTSIYFYSWLLLFWLLLTDIKKRYIAFSGIFFGLLFYVYPFAWIFAAVLQGLLFLYFIIRKEFQKSRHILFAVGIGLLISLFYWVNWYHLVKNPFYDELQKHLAFYHSRGPVWGNILFLDIGLLFLLYFYQKRSQLFILTTGAILTSFLVLNQQVITNFRFFPGHWYWYYLTPFSIFLGIAAFFSVIKSSKRLRYALAGGIIIISFLGGFFSQRNYYLAEKGKAVENQRYAVLFGWLNQNTAKESVVLTPDPLALIMPAYSHNNHYLVDTADVLSLIPDDRYRHDFFVKIYLEGARADNLDKYINQRTPDFIQLLYGYYRRYAYGCNECYPEEDLLKLKQDYLEFLKKDFEQEVKKYKIDYLVIDRKTNQWDYEGLTFIKPIQEIGDFLVFKVI